MSTRQILFFFLFVSIKFGHCNNDGFCIPKCATPCSQNPELQDLENRIEALEKNSNCDGYLPRNCQEVLERGHTASGVYKIKPSFSTKEISVLCNMKTQGGGWTYFLNRYDGSQDFYLNWAPYKKGFGDLEGEFWLGLDNIHLLTGYELNQLLIELVDWEDKMVSGHFDLFTIAGESEGYRLKHLQGYSGDAGDSLSNQLGMKFTTKDRDNDVWVTENCAIFSNSSWWFKDCKRGNPTGVYLGQNFDPKDNLKGIFWDTFHGNTYSLKQVRMMVKPHRPTNANPAFKN